jgi:hypothetical protein
MSSIPTTNATVPTVTVAGSFGPNFRLATPPWMGHFGWVVIADDRYLAGTRARRDPPGDVPIRWA